MCEMSLHVSDVSSVGGQNKEGSSLSRMRWRSNPQLKVACCGKFPFAAFFNNDESSLAASWAEKKFLLYWLFVSLITNRSDWTWPFVTSKSGWFSLKIYFSGDREAARRSLVNAVLLDNKNVAVIISGFVYITDHFFCDKPSLTLLTFF